MTLLHALAVWWAVGSLTFALLTVLFATRVHWLGLGVWASVAGVVGASFALWVTS